MSENPFPVRLAQETAQTLHRLAGALDEAARVLLAGKLAAGRVAEAEQRLAAARAETEAARREREGIAAETEGERMRAREALEVDLAAERVRIARVIESERLAVTTLEQQRTEAAGALVEAQRLLRETREATVAAAEAARLEAIERREAQRADLSGQQAELAAITQRVAAKRKEYQALLERVKAVLRA